MEKFEGLNVVNKKVILGYTVLILGLDKSHIGKKKPPFYGLYDEPGFYWMLKISSKQWYYGPFKKTKDAFKDAELFIEKKAGVI